MKKHISLFLFLSLVLFLRSPLAHGQDSIEVVKTMVFISDSEDFRPGQEMLYYHTDSLRGTEYEEMQLHAGTIKSIIIADVDLYHAIIKVLCDGQMLPEVSRLTITGNGAEDTLLMLDRPMLERLKKIELNNLSVTHSLDEILEDLENVERTNVTVLTESVPMLVVMRNVYSGCDTPMGTDSLCITYGDYEPEGIEQFQALDHSKILELSVENPSFMIDQVDWSQFERLEAISFWGNDVDFLTNYVVPESFYNIPSLRYLFIEQIDLSDGVIETLDWVYPFMESSRY